MAVNDFKEFSKLNGIAPEIQRVQHNAWIQFNQIKKNINDQNEANATTISTINSEIASINSSLNAFPLSDGAFVAFTGVANGFPYVVGHPLGRVPIGYIWVDFTSPVPIGGVRMQREAWDASTITFLFLGITGADTFKIWIF